jgi:hypothetical protein
MEDTAFIDIIILINDWRFFVTLNLKVIHYLVLINLFKSCVMAEHLSTLTDNQDNKLADYIRIF